MAVGSLSPDRGCGWGGPVVGGVSGAAAWRRGAAEASVSVRGCVGPVILRRGRGRCGQPEGSGAGVAVCGQGRGVGLAERVRGLRVVSEGIPTLLSVNPSSRPLEA